jgi:sirohydrochlorin cobaltochelatase
LRRGLVLFAHGSRDPRWARPFRALKKKLSSRFEVEVAYLEWMQPSLEKAISRLKARGRTRVRVIPVFLGLGGHVRQDLPRLIAKSRKAHPGLKISLERPIGEQPRVLAAIARAIAGGSASPARSAPRS